MNRRNFLTVTAARAAGGALAGLAAGCTFAQTPAAREVQVAAAQDAALPEVTWPMATSWPESLDILFGTAQALARRVGELTGGRFTIEPRPAGDLAPAGQVLDVVAAGTAPIGHTAAYYYTGKTPAAAFGTTLPFGLNAQQQNAWLYAGGGLALTQALFADKFGVVPLPAGNTGMQMGGWFRREIETVADLAGLKLRIAGLGGAVMARLGVNVQVLPAGELAQALQSGAIDAAEWVGPYDDEKLGLHKAATYYYTPGWWEPASTIEVEINQRAWERLPDLYRAAVQVAAAEANNAMLAQYEAANPPALERLVAAGAQVRHYSDEIMVAAHAAAMELYAELAAKDADFKTIFAQWDVFRRGVQGWNRANEFPYAAFVYAQT